MVVKTEWAFLFKSWHLLFLLFSLYAGFSLALFVIPVLYSTPDKQLVPQLGERLASMGLSQQDVTVLGAPIS
ncbi:unnamed protein product, partial [Mesorhabditis spiculigera]